MSYLKFMTAERERWSAWLPTGHQGAYAPSTPREYQPDQNYAQENHGGYGEGSQSSNMENGYEQQYSSQLPVEDEISNLLQLLLETQKRGAACLLEGLEKIIESIPMYDTQITDRTQDSSIAETTCVEPITTKPSQWTEDNKEDHILPQETVMVEKPPSDIHLPLQKTYAVSTEDSEIQVGEDFCEKITQGDRPDVITRPGDRVKPTSAEKPFISRKNETLYVPPPYKPPLPFPGRIKEESMETYKEISEEQLKEIDVHMPLVDEIKLIPPHLKFPKEAVIEKNAQTKDDFLLDAEECIKEFDLLLGCTVDENFMIRYEEQVKPVAIMISSTKSNGDVVGVVGKTFEVPCEAVVVLEHIADKHIDIASTYEVSSDEPRKIPFEEIRMKAFRGWFYDEYAPGDTWIH